MAANAFTLDDHIYFDLGQYDPTDGTSDIEMALIGHEATHVRQYRQNGSLRQKGRYLFNSAKNGVKSAIFFTLLGQNAVNGFDAESYYGNDYEIEATGVEQAIQKDLLRFGNPCK
jgi:Domain of unknown function (DUF4157)